MEKVIIREEPPLYQKDYLPGLFQIAVVLLPPPDVLAGKKLPRAEFQSIGSKASGLSDISTFTRSPVSALQLMSNLICRSRILSMGGSFVVIVTTASSRPIRAESRFERAPANLRFDGFGGIFGEYGLEHVVQANINEVVGFVESYGGHGSSFFSA
jgi:hypothetical protein